MSRYLVLVLLVMLLIHGTHAAGSLGMSIRVYNDSPMVLRLWIPRKNGLTSDLSRIEYLVPGESVLVDGKDVRMLSAYAVCWNMCMHVTHNK